MTETKGIWKKAFVLALAGGLAFWLANFAISRTAIAAEYRAALSISYYPMLLAALVGGLFIGLCVSYCLLRFYDRIPANDPLIKSGLISLIVLILVTVLMGGPSSFSGTNNVLRYFIIGTIFNFIRILALGLAIGYVYKNRNHSKLSPPPLLDRAVDQGPDGRPFTRRDAHRSEPKQS